MKIFHVLCSNRVGGLEQAYVNMSMALMALGHNVTNFFPEQAPYKDKMKDYGKHIDFYPKNFYDVKAVWALRQQIKKQKPDVLVCHNSRAVQIAHWARLGTGVPIIGFSHGSKTRRLMKADYVVALTSEMRDSFLMSGKAPETIDIFPNMIIAFPDNPLPLPQVREKIVFGFMGRFVHEKGLEDLLQALFLLKEKGFSFHLSIAGSGKDESKIRKYVEQYNLLDSLSFHGWIDDIRAWFKDIDIAIFPSRYESFGLTVLEAHMHGRPVISTYTAGPKSQIQNNVNGFLALPGNPKSLADTIEQAIAQKDRWPEIVANGFESAKQYRMENLLPKLEAILRKSIGSY